MLFGYYSGPLIFSRSLLSNSVYVYQKISMSIKDKHFLSIHQYGAFFAWYYEMHQNKHEIYD